jgi:hypothetical protein
MIYWPHWKTRAWFLETCKMSNKISNAIKSNPQHHPSLKWKPSLGSLFILMCLANFSPLQSKLLVTKIIIFYFFYQPVKNILMKWTVKLSIRIKISYNSFRKAIKMRMDCNKNLQNKICTYVWSFLKKDK